MVEDILQALAGVVDPASGKDVVRLNMIRELQVTDDSVSLTVWLRDPLGDFARQVESLCRQALLPVIGETARLTINVDSDMVGLDVEPQSARQAPVAPDATNIIAVASGKGGVGKSTVAANLAVALAQDGLDVGLADMDMYGPSVPTMFGVAGERPTVSDRKKIVPLERHGVKLLSMGFLVDPDKAVIWRGPMVSGAVRQFLGEAEWSGLDYLILDLPPGTGDIQLTLVQSVPLTAAIVVSTPQRVALADARKGVAMFEQVSVPVLGIVENMAYFSPPDDPDKRYHLFGKHGARLLANDIGVDFLGEIPIEESLMESCDAGYPAVLSMPESQAAAAFRNLARTVAAKVRLQNAGVTASGGLEIVYE